MQKADARKARRTPEQMAADEALEAERKREQQLAATTIQAHGRGTIVRGHVARHKQALLVSGGAQMDWLAYDSHTRSRLDDSQAQGAGAAADEDGADDDAGDDDGGDGDAGD